MRNTMMARPAMPPTTAPTMEPIGVDSEEDSGPEVGDGLVEDGDGLIEDAEEAIVARSSSPSVDTR